MDKAGNKLEDRMMNGQEVMYADNYGETCVIPSAHVKSMIMEIVSGARADRTAGIPDSDILDGARAYLHKFLDEIWWRCPDIRVMDGVRYEYIDLLDQCMRDVLGLG